MYGARAVATSTFKSDEDYQRYLQENLGNKYAKYIEIQQKAKADGEILTKDNIAALFKHKEQKQLIKEFLFND